MGELITKVDDMAITMVTKEELKVTMAAHTAAIVDAIQGNGRTNY